MSTLARTTGAPNRDNTGANLAYDFQQPAFASTIALVLKKDNTLVQPAQLTGVVTFTANVGTGTADRIPPFVGQRVRFLLQSDGTSRVVTFGTGFAPNGTLSVTTAKFATIGFIFNGTVWQETGRTTTA